MSAIQKIGESLGLVGVQATLKKAAKAKSEAQKLIPPKKGRGSRTAVEKQSCAWIVALIESVFHRSGGRQEEIPPLVSLPCLDIRVEKTAAERQCHEWIVAIAESSFDSFGNGQEEILPVICLPCLDIRIESRVEKTPAISEQTSLSKMARAFTSPPTPSPSKVMGVPVTPMKSSPTPATKNIHQIVSKSPEVKLSPNSQPSTTIQADSGLDKDLVGWMKVASDQFLTLAGQRPHSGHRWGFRMAQVAVGLEVMMKEVGEVKGIFPVFVGALFEMVDAARSTKDLDLLEYIIKNAVYLDLLAEAAEFQTKRGLVSVNLQNFYDEKYLGFDAANESLNGRG